MPHVSNIPQQAAIAFDQFVNALCGGWADETLSARCWRLRQAHAGWRCARMVVDGIFFWQKDHCRAAYVSETLRLHSPPEHRG